MKREEVLILLSFLLFVQGYLLENVFSALLGFSILLYLVFLRQEFLPDIKIEWNLRKNLESGKKTKIKYRVKNLTNKKLKVIIGTDFLPFGFKADPLSLTLSGKENKDIEQAIIPVKGSYTLKGPIAKILDVRGLYFSEYRGDSDIEIEVYPSLEEIRDGLKEDKQLRATKLLKKYLFGLKSPEIDSLKKFELGDDLKHVDWKATARLGELIVKDLLKETESDVYLIIDAGSEMRKSLWKSKVDYITALTLQIAYLLLKRHRVGVIVHDDFRIVHHVVPKKSEEQIKLISRSLAIAPKHSAIPRLKFSDINLKISSASINFLNKILPIIKKRKSIATGLMEAIKLLPESAFLIFVSDITSNTAELMSVLYKLNKKHDILLLTPNPILFYDENKLTRDTLIHLYQRYIEREEVLKKFRKIVPTIDLGPSDFVDVIQYELIKGEML